MADQYVSIEKTGLVSDRAAAEDEVEVYLTHLVQSGNQAEDCIPFTLDRQQADEAFTRWLRGLSLAPGDLARSAELGTLRQVYVPFWSVSARTCTSYQGERGEEYQDTETCKDASGASQQRQVTRIGWTPVEGEVCHHFENVLLCGAADLPDTEVALLAPKDQRGVQRYHGNGKIVVQRSGLDARAAFHRACTAMEEQIRQLVEKDIGGKQQKVNKLQTRHVGVTLQQVLVPAWEGTYLYKAKGYRVLIHGATGEATGECPVSAGKVLLAVLLFLLVVGAILAAVYFFLIRSNLEDGARHLSPSHAFPAAHEIPLSARCRRAMMRGPARAPQRPLAGRDALHEDPRKLAGAAATARRGTGLGPLRRVVHPLAALLGAPGGMPGG